MSQNTSANNRRIAKNTVFLYFRTLLLLAITLYTSRIVLAALGVDDYGIYNVVGGLIAMFSMVSGALSTSISRFITFEIGRGDYSRLHKIFCTSVNIQIIIGVVILLLGETLGVWFLNTQMNIPENRMIAANWVLQCSVLSFIVGLVSIPYNAVIIAHEKMGAFAYISILEAVLKLVIVYILIYYQHDKLILYAILHVVVAIVIRVVYGFYCDKHFNECHYRLVFDKSLIKEMSGFAGWSFLTNSAYMLNTQGVNILMNIYFGVAINAARGIATQVDSAVMQFVTNFTMAVNPQITKSYAAGEMESMFKLVCRGSKFSYYMMLFFVVPFLFEADTILALWLKDVPDYAATFLRLSIIASMANLIGNTQWTACQATGDLKRYVSVIIPLGLLIFPITWILYMLGMPVESSYYVFIGIYLVLDVARLFLMKSMLGFSIRKYSMDVLFVIAYVTLAVLILPAIEVSLLPPTYLRLPLTIIVSSISIVIFVYLLGLTKSERTFIMNVVKNKIFSSSIEH